MSGDTITMPENSLMMIHDPAGMVVGNADDMRDMAEALDKVKTGLMSAYRNKTGLNEERISELMSEETWMTASEAKLLGFADEVTEAVKIAASFDLKMFKNVPKNLDLGGFKNMDKDTDKNYKKDLYAERERVLALRTIGKEFKVENLADTAIQEGWTEDQLRLAVLQEIRAKSPTSSPSFSRIGNPLPAHDGKPFRNFGEQLIAIKNASISGGKVDSRLFEITDAAAGMSEAVPSEGGFMLQPDFTTELLTKANETAVLMPLCYRVPVSGNGLRAPVIDETSRATGSRLGGVQAYWVAEATEVTSKKPKLAMLELSLKKLMGLSFATDELLEDAAALEAVITRGFSEEIGFLVDAAIVSGTGAGQPLGILNSNALVTVAKETGQTADTIVVENILNMYSRMHRQGKTRAVWLLNGECWPQLFGFHLPVTYGVPMFLPPGGLNQTPYSTLLGRPIFEVEQCEKLGDVGDILFADLGQYLLIDKASGINTQTSIHVKFLTDETAFRFTYRCDGQPIWKSAVTPYKGSATRSPFITLAERA